MNDVGTNGEGEAGAPRGHRSPSDERDAVLMEVAGWVEESSLLDLPGILSKRKRDREDAHLRRDTAIEVRANIARIIRGRMQNKVGNPLDFLADVKVGRHDRFVTGFILRQAIALADKGLLRVAVETQIAGDWNNVVGGSTDYRISLTDAGEQALAKASTP